MQRLISRDLSHSSDYQMFFQAGCRYVHCNEDMHNRIQVIKLCLPTLRSLSLFFKCSAMKVTPFNVALILSGYRYRLYTEVLCRIFGLFACFSRCRMRNRAMFLSFSEPSCKASSNKTSSFSFFWSGLLIQSTCGRISINTFFVHGVIL